MRFLPNTLKNWIFVILQSSGLSPSHAGAAADVFIRATLRGQGHHDISYLPQRLDWLENHGVNPRPEFKSVTQAPAAEVWDADHGLGEVACHFATLRAVDLARKNGMGYAAVRNSNHFLAASPYTDMAAEAGCMALVWTNTDAGMALPGGSSRQMGNNPLGFAFPRREGALTADFSMAYSSLGNLVTAQKNDQTLPGHWGVDGQGRPTGDPAQLLAGAVRPIGEHKGFALALLGELLTGMLAQGPTFDQVAPGGGVNTHNQAVIAWDLGFFGGLENAQARADDLAQRMKGAQPGLRVPGENSLSQKKKGLTQGIEVDPQTWEKLCRWSEGHGVAIPSPW